MSMRVALLGVQGARPFTPLDPLRDSIRAVDRDTVLLPEILIEQVPQDAPALLRPRGDALWNCVGLGQSPNYDADGA
jgi:hypothetical protein